MLRKSCWLGCLGSKIIPKAERQPNQQMKTELASHGEEGGKAKEYAWNRKTILHYFIKNSLKYVIGQE